MWQAAQGIKIAAQNLETAVAGTQLYVLGSEDDVEALKEEVMEDMQDIFSSVDRSGVMPHCSIFTCMRRFMRGTLLSVNSSFALAPNPRN